MSLKALAKSPSAFLIAAVSRATFTSTGEVVSLLTVSVTPAMTLSSLFVADDTARPLIVACAFLAACVWDICPGVVAGLKARADKPLASVLLPSLSTAVMRTALLAPVFAEVSTNFAPPASVTMDAVTPALAALILVLIASSESLPGAMSMSMAVFVASAVKVVSPSSQPPSSMCRVPLPTVVAEVAYALDARFCTLASCVTLTR
jgi:hypothetical protein